MGLDRHRAGQAAIDIALAAKLRRLEDAGHGGGSAYRHAGIPGTEDDALAAVEIGGDGGERLVEFFQRPVLQMLVDEILQRLAFQEAAAA